MDEIQLITQNHEIMTEQTGKPSANQAAFYHGIGTEMIPEGIFERFPELIPAVGDNYWRADGKHKKLLLVGESNYFPAKLEAKSVFRDPEKWYKGAETDKLIPESMKTAVNNWKDYKTFNRVYKVMDEELDKNGIEYLPKYGESTFYNYFLRPALNTGACKRFTPEDIDKEVAGLALAGIINRLEPDLVIFLSKKAFNEFEHYYKVYYPTEYKKECIDSCRVSIDCVVHPASIWWNRKGGEMGKTRFRNLLVEHWL